MILLLLKKIFAISGILLTGFLMLSCDPGQKLSDLQIDNSNALRARLEFSISDVQQPVLHYWSIDEKDDKHHVELGTEHEQEIVLYLLKPSTEYAFTVTSGEESGIKSSDTLHFETARMPVTLPKLTLMIDSGNVFDGYIMLRKVEDPAQQFLIDNEGEIVWYHQFDTALSRFYSWTGRGTILSLHDEDKIVELDLAGNVLNTFRYGEGGFDQHLHHEIIENDRGEILSLTRNMKLFDLRAFGGLEQDTIYGDGILVLDQKGNKVWEWDIYEFEDPLKDENINAMKKDWSHGNSLAIDQDGNYLVSFRNFHQVWKIDSGTGEVHWKLGMNGNFDLNDEEIFYSQHTAYANHSGELMLFDNGGPERMFSRAISFDINSPGDYERGKIWVTLPGELYSFKEGSAYLIGDDKVLFCSSRTNQLVITDLEGEVLWQIRSSESFYRAYYIDKIPAFFQSR